MAERQSDELRELEEALDARQGPDRAFQLQVRLADFVLGYWKHGLVLLGVALLGVLVYSLYEGWFTSRQVEASARIAVVDRKLAELDPTGFATRLADDPDKRAFLEKAAELYERVGEESFGPASAEAWLKAGETWARVGEQERRVEACRAALEAEGTDLFEAGARDCLAAALLELGRDDEAIAQLQALADGEGVFAERALMELARIQRARGDEAALAATVERYRTRFGDSPRAERFLLRYAPDAG